MAGMVVGVDGSDHSHRALTWAMKEAAIRHVPLTVLAVHAVAASAWTGNPIILPGDKDVVNKIRGTVEETVAKTAAEIGQPQPPSVTVLAMDGFPAHELIEASRDAELVVLGSRGAGGFTSLMIGSVSSQVVHHAHCPVVVVPHER
jgi:nucleotide-binding universal stress UspA family protein